jgi:hypothetical protein
MKLRNSVVCALSKIPQFQICLDSPKILIEERFALEKKSEERASKIFLFNVKGCLRYKCVSYSTPSQKFCFWKICKFQIQMGMKKLRKVPKSQSGLSEAI